MDQQKAKERGKPKVKVVRVKRTRIRTVVKAVAAGAAVMYFFDPDRGKARRARPATRRSRWAAGGSGRASG
jgi:hypothetical protein